MTKLLKKILIVVLTVTSVFAFSFTGQAKSVWAEETAMPPIYPSDNSAGGNDAVIGIEGSFVATDINTILNRLNEIRQEAYNEKLINKYVPLKWSNYLETHSQVRAAEASAFLSHTRPDSAGSRGCNGRTAEVLAWGYWLTEMSGINMWYAEKQYITRKSDGTIVEEPGQETGHYWAMVNPDYDYVAISAFDVDDRWSCAAGEFGSSSWYPSVPYNQSTSNRRSGKAIQKIVVKRSLVTANSVTPTQLELEAGQTGQVYITGTYRGQGLSSNTFNVSSYIFSGSFSSANPSIAQVDADGRVTGKSGGTTTIEATFGGNKIADKVQVTVKDTEPALGTPAVRIYGSNRFETARSIANAYKETNHIEKLDAVIVASGNNFPDALAGSYLSGKKNAPILLAIDNPRVVDDTVQYIQNNVKADGTVYILGGASAVPTTLDARLSNYNVKRLAGNNRYDTNLMILEEAGMDQDTILVCSGQNFPDSLSASATGRPILLVGSRLTDKQKEFLSTHTINKVYVIGGSAAVSDEVFDYFYNTVPEGARLAGKNRYETSEMVARQFFYNPQEAVLAYAQNFPDALSGGAFALSQNAPLLLTATDRQARAQAYCTEKGVHKGYVLGGESLINDATVRSILQLPDTTRVRVY